MIDEEQRHRSGYGGVDLRDPNPNDRDPLGGHHMMSGRTNQYDKTRNNNSETYFRDFSQAVNPNTGTRYTSTNVNTPNWSYERSTDPSGFGQERYNGGDFNNFWLRGGGQDYYPGTMEGIGSLKEQAAVDPADWRNILRILEAGGDPGTETQTAMAPYGWDYAARGGLMSLRR
jgi:hypothetical protein|tara:strand:- start:43 stop:561 length:519 start_codon:yes stop_codon:yes gene_type:complete